MPRTLYARLALILVALSVLVGAGYLAVTWYATSWYVQEVQQRLNHDFAAHLSDELPLIADGAVNEEALEHAFHMMMVINPSIEIYLLAPDGRILAFSAPEEKIVREAVALGPIEAFLAGTRDDVPISGDDPRHTSRQKVFSASRIVDGKGTLQGYLYVVLGGEDWDSVAQLLERSHVMRLALLGVLASIAFGIVAGLLLFRRTTARLRQLDAAVRDFETSGELRLGGGLARGRAGDEIDRLAASFRRVADRLDARMTELRENDALRRELVASVSHDLRTPLAALRGYIETVQLKGDAVSRGQRDEYLDTALTHCDRLEALIGDLFELAKLDARQSAPHAEAFSIRELAHDVAQKFHLRSEERGVEIAVDAADDLPFAWGEIGLLERVLENLLDNALRYTGPGGEVRIGLSRAGAAIRVTVADTGSGIPADKLPRIFERFYRVDEDTSRGTGLGLAIVKRILELHGSPIDVASEPQAGTTFAFRLPVHEFAA